MTRILVVDDHEVVRAGLCRLLEGEADMKVVAQTGRGHEAVRLCRELKPDVVLLDYGLPDLDGLETTRQIVELKVGAAVMVLTMHGSEEYATRLIQTGAKGFVVKVAPAEELLMGIRRVANGRTYVCTSILEKMVDRIGMPLEEIPESTLSNRELQVLINLAQGMTTREVAQTLNLSTSTVETYRGRVLEKLRLRNNSDMTRFAIRRGLINA